MSNFIESNLSIIFDEEWTVVKLDEHKYYQSISGQGVSCVDFLAWHPEFGLALIEVKNYRGNGLPSHQRASQIMQKKQEGTVQLIRVIQKYHQRRWMYRFLTYLNLKFLYPKDWRLWREVHLCMEEERYFFLGILDE